MKYTYYKRIERPEHLYFVEELYEFYKAIIPHDLKPKDLHHIIKGYTKLKGIELEPLYHMTRNGLKRVYDVSIALDAISYHVSGVNMAIKEEKRNESSS